jgi:AcrR family transcriptional regulator
MPNRADDTKLDGQATNTRLHDSAVHLFAQRGYSATTTRQIASRAGVTVGSLYNHVASKQEMLFRVMRTTHEHALAALDSALVSAMNPVDALHAAMRAHVLFHTDYGAPIAVTYQEMRVLDDKHRRAIVALRDQYGRRFKAIVTRGIEDGVFESEAPNLAVIAMLTMGTQISTWFKARDVDSAARVADAYAEFALRMVGYRGNAARRSRTANDPKPARRPGQPRQAHVS